MSSSRRMLAVVAAVAVGSAAVGWVAGQTIKSPAEVAADAEPPEASLVTVPVEEVALTSNVVIRGQISFSESYQVQASAGAGGVAIVTGLPVAEGDDLVEGQVLAEIAGRPMIALQGQLPVFRSLTPGLEGPDVQQLEEALIRLGYDPGVVDEVYSADTEAAVAALYRDVGYRPDEPDIDELERLEQARTSVRAAQQSLEVAIEASSASIPTSTQLEWNRAVAQADEALQAAVATRSELVNPLITAHGLATEARIVAERSLADATASGDQAAIVAAETALSDAQAAETAAEDEKDTVWAEQNEIVDELEFQAQLTQAQRAEAFAQYEGVGAGSGVSDARESLADARDNLVRLEAEIGVTFPSNELVFLPSLPSRVQDVFVELGSFPQGALMTITGQSVTITSSVSTSDRALVVEGAEGVMEDEALGISLPVRVVFVAANPGGGDLASDRYRVELEPLEEIPSDAIGLNLRVTLPFESTDGTVLAVPLAALSAGADGSARVEVERADGTVELVTVTPGLNSRAQGLVEITPIDGDLAAGDRVVVGREQGGADNDSDPADSSDEPDSTDETDGDG
ncbi:MAG: peptidoglycan-binding protein [Acidimicrobiales bacterium]